MSAPPERWPNRRLDRLHRLRHGLTGAPGVAVSALLVALLVVVALTAPWLAGMDPAAQPDPVAGDRLPPGSVRVPVVFRDGRELLGERVERRGEQLVVFRLGRSETYPASSVANLGPRGVPEAHRFLLGTDAYSRDVWARLVYGARISLAIGLLAVAIALTLGVLVGALAAIGGELVDGVLMRLVDAFLSVPRLFLLLALTAFLKPSLTTLVLILGFTGWMSVARFVRAEILSLQERDFVLAARALGAHPLRILRVHLLPNAMTPVLVAAGLLVADVILVESSLSFLELGVQPPTPSWGAMIDDGRTLVDAWWVATFPGLALVLTVVSFNLLADGLRDWLDPRS